MGCKQLRASQSFALINDLLIQPGHPYVDTLMKSGEAGKSLFQDC
jgi:hypothetical protein